MAWRSTSLRDSTCSNCSASLPTSGSRSKSSFCSMGAVSCAASASTAAGAHEAIWLPGIDLIIETKRLTPASKGFCPLASSALSVDRSMYCLPPSFPSKSDCHEDCERQRGSNTTGMILATPFRLHARLNSKRALSSSPLAPYPVAFFMYESVRKTTTHAA